MSTKIAMPMLGVLLWVLSIHSGTFIDGLIIESYSDRHPYPVFKARSIKEKSGVYMKITEKNLNDSVASGENIVNRMARLETNLGWADIHVLEGTPVHGQLIASSPEDETLDQGRAALIAARASQNLLNTKCPRLSTNKLQCAKQLGEFKLLPTAMKNICIKTKATCRPSDLTASFRATDGSCNNIADGNRGKSFTPYKRIMAPAYLDAIMEPRRAVSKRPLPSARLVSTRMAKDMDLPDSKLTLAFMQWSEFVAHDMSRTAVSKMISSKKSIRCCTPDGYSLSPRHIHPMCMPIIIPSDDGFYSEKRSNCMSYTRSLLALRSDCSLGPVDQMNQATHFLDGSHIYGSTVKKANNLRVFVGGRLQTSTKDGREFLPFVSNAKELCQGTAEKTDCYTAGDTRVNMHPHLTAMHTFWTREHNRIAELLSDLNPHWNDERLYQETRRIVVAQIQHITYDQWLPIVIGTQNADKIVMHNKYRADIDPAVSNSFATAALKFSDSLMESQLHMYGENRVANAALRLQDHYNKPVIVQSPGNLDGLVRGLATQRSQKMDLAFISDITQELYRIGEFGMDALSLDIQRGRDHGLPPYVAYREQCENRKISRFEDLADIIPKDTLRDLTSVYDNVNDIDVLVGALAEKPLANGLLGSTFTCLIREQMYRTRVGDRYFYTHDTHFTSAQMAEIKKASLAKIFCENGDDIQRMQPNVFTIISAENKLVNCKDTKIGRVELEAWRELTWR